MDLPVIGSHCSTCRELDLLPIRCTCDRYFCRHHISPESHSCPIDLAVDKHSSGILAKLQRCAVESCGRLSLESFAASISSNYSSNDGRIAATCALCQRSFCVDHRYPDSHSCLFAQDPVKVNQKARALLAKHFSSTTNIPARRRISKIPTDPIKLAQYRNVELMKLRHTAVPADSKDKGYSTPVDDRLYVKIRVEGLGAVQTEKILWFHKSTITGKALDLASSQLRISSSVPCQFTRERTEDIHNCILLNDQLLNSQVEEGSVLIIRPKQMV